FFFFQAEDGIRDRTVTGVQTCALPISVMAKSVEDTAFYIYSRLVSLNEVGSDPRTFGMSVKEFHYQNAERRRCWPHAMLATSTRSEERRVGKEGGSRLRRGGCRETSSR